MAQTPHPDLTIGQAHGGLLKNLIEQHKLVENQVLSQEEAEKLLKHPYDAPKPLEIQDLLHRAMAEVSRQRHPRPSKAPAREHQA